MTADKTSDPGDPSAGASSVADEAARLAQAFAGWARNAQLGAEHAAAPSVDDDAGAETPQARPLGCDCAHGGTAEAVCRICPVCRAAGLVQAIQPELLDRVADLLGVVASGLHSAADQRRAADEPAADEPVKDHSSDEHGTGDDD